MKEARRGDPVRVVVDDQRSWLFGALADRSPDIGHLSPCVSSALRCVRCSIVVWDSAVSVSRVAARPDCRQCSFAGLRGGMVPHMPHAEAQAAPAAASVRCALSDSLATVGYASCGRPGLGRRPGARLGAGRGGGGGSRVIAAFDGAGLTVGEATARYAMRRARFSSCGPVYRRRRTARCCGGVAPVRR